MLLQIKDAQFCNREQKISIRNINLHMHTYQWVTVRSESYGISKDFLRGLNAQSSSSWTKWNALEVCLSEWDTSQYRSLFPLITNEPVGWSGSVEQALKIPFYWKNHRKKTWPQPMIEQWLYALGFSDHTLKKHCDILERHDLLKLSLIRALSLEPTVLLIDDIWTSFSHKEKEQVVNILKLWLHPRNKKSRAIITADQNSIVQHHATHRYILDQEGLQKTNFLF
ncbi:MAG: hypothetical protein AB8C84_09895 [Oligoflexales bacterium]